MLRPLPWEKKSILKYQVPESTGSASRVPEPAWLGARGSGQRARTPGPGSGGGARHVCIYFILLQMRALHRYRDIVLYPTPLAVVVLCIP